MKALIAVLILSFTAVTLLAVATTPDGTTAVTTDRWMVVEDLGQTAMLQSHRPMMDQMRTAVVRGMAVRMPGDPMREMLDARMVRLMEQDQRQMDRMAGRR